MERTAWARCYYSDMIENWPCTASLIIIIPSILSRFKVIARPLCVSGAPGRRASLVSSLTRISSLWLMGLRLSLPHSLHFAPRVRLWQHYNNSCDAYHVTFIPQQMSMFSVCPIHSRRSALPYACRWSTFLPLITAVTPTANAATSASYSLSHVH